MYLANWLWKDKDHSPWISEFYTDCYWFDTVDLYHQELNQPVRGDIKADIAIIGGGFTGLSAAYHLIRKFPDKKIVILESAYCGYGASGRNAGATSPVDFRTLKSVGKSGIEAIRKFVKLNLQSLEIMREYVEKEGLAFDWEENGTLTFAFKESHLEKMETECQFINELGIPARMLDRTETKKEVATDRYYGSLLIELGGIINPMKLALGLKGVVDKAGVEIFERSKVVSIEPGASIQIRTETGNITAPALVLATNAYSATLGFFKKRYIPLIENVTVTEPLTKKQLASINWDSRRVLADSRLDIDYFTLTKDNRILSGGHVCYRYGGKLASGPHPPSHKGGEESLFKTFPQLQGLKIAYKWSGTMCWTRDFCPSYGQTGPNNNIYYAYGYSGHGVATTQLAGKIISQLYADEDTELTRLFNVNRIPPYLPPEPFRYLAFNTILSAGR